MDGWMDGWMKTLREHNGGATQNGGTLLMLLTVNAARLTEIARKSSEDTHCDSTERWRNTNRRYAANDSTKKVLGDDRIHCDSTTVAQGKRWYAAKAATLGLTADKRTEDGRMGYTVKHNGGARQTTVHCSKKLARMDARTRSLTAIAQRWHKANGWVRCYADGTPNGNGKRNDGSTVIARVAQGKRTVRCERLRATKTD
jgi:hypothetical protein